MVESPAKEVGMDKNMFPDVLHHNRKGVLLLLDTRRYGSFSNCNCDWNVSKSRQTFHEPYTRVYIMICMGRKHVPYWRASASYKYHETSPQMVVNETLCQPYAPTEEIMTMSLLRGKEIIIYKDITSSTLTSLDSVMQNPCNVMGDTGG